MRLMDVKLEYPPRCRTTMKPVIILYTRHVYPTRGDLYKNEGDPKGLSIICVDKRRRGVNVTVVEPVNVLLNWPPRGDFERRSSELLEGRDFGPEGFSGVSRVAPYVSPAQSSPAAPPADCSPQGRSDTVQFLHERVRHSCALVWDH